MEAKEILRWPRYIPPPKYLGIFVLDGSGSMSEMTAGHITKADTVSSSLNDVFSRLKASRIEHWYNFAIVNYDHRSIVKMQPTPLKDIDDCGDYNPMDGLGGVTYISEGLKDAKKIAENFLNQSENGRQPRHVVVMILTDGFDMTQSETIRIANALKRMNHVTVTGCFIETLSYDVGEMDCCADYIKGLCSEEGLFERVANEDDLRLFFIKSMSHLTEIYL